MRRRPFIIGAAIGAVVLVVIIAPAVWFLSPGPSISVQPGGGSVRPGVAFTVMGVRFPANREVYVGLAAPGVPPTAGTSFVTAATDRNGKFSVPFVYPVDATWMSLQQVTLYAGTPEGDAVAKTSLFVESAAVPGSTELPSTGALYPTAVVLYPTAPVLYPTAIVVTSWPYITPEPMATATTVVVPSATLGPIPTIILQPMSGLQGSTIIVTGRGWRANESLILSLLGFRAQINVGAANADAQGSFATSITLPTDWGAPTATVLARTLDGSLQTTAVFQVLLPTNTPAPTRTPPPTLTPIVITGWKGEYFNNPFLRGNSLVIQDDSNIDFDWGFTPPAPGMPNARYSARWTRTLYFSAGYYRFSAYVDDGMRIWLDENLIMDEWHPASGQQYNRDVDLVDGLHTLRVEYYQDTGPAYAHASWQQIPPPTVTPPPTHTLTPPTATLQPTHTLTPPAVTVTATVTVTASSTSNP